VQCFAALCQNVLSVNSEMIQEMELIELFENKKVITVGCEYRV